MPQDPPKIIEGCYTETLSKLGAPCFYWIRKADGYSIVPHFSTDPTEAAQLERFDSTGMAISVTWGAATDRDVMRFTGTIKGNRIEGIVTQSITAGATTTGGKAGIPWTGWFFYPPSKEARSGQTAFLTCDAQITLGIPNSKASMLDIGDHSVVTINLPLNQFQSPIAMTVSHDGTKAYMSTDGQTPTRYPAKLLVLDATAGKVTQVFDLKNTPVPSGFTSLAIAGDGVTLYGSGQNIKQNGTMLIAMDATTGAILSAIPYQPKDPAHQNARMVMAGARVVLGDGTIANLPSPKGGVAIFGSDGKGLSAFPDGQKLCVSGKTLLIGGQDPGIPRQACSVVAGGSTVVAPGSPRASGAPTSLDVFRPPTRCCLAQGE